MSGNLSMKPLYLCISRVSAESQVSILIPKRTLIVHLLSHDRFPQRIEKQLLCWTNPFLSGEQNQGRNSQLVFILALGNKQEGKKKLKEYRKNKRQFPYASGPAKK